MIKSLCLNYFSLFVVKELKSKTFFVILEDWYDVICLLYSIGMNWKQECIGVMSLAISATDKVAFLFLVEIRKWG